MPRFEKGSLRKDLNGLTPQEAYTLALNNANLMRSGNAVNLFFSTVVCNYIEELWGINKSCIKVLAAIHTGQVKGQCARKVMVKLYPHFKSTPLLSKCLSELVVSEYIIERRVKIKLYSLTGRGRKVIQDYSACMSRLCTHYHLHGEVLDLRK